MKTYLICLPIFIGVTNFNVLLENQRLSPIFHFDDSCKVKYQANETTFKNKIFILKGNAELKFGNTSVQAEEIYLDNENHKLKAFKKIKYKSDKSVIVTNCIDSLILELPICKETK